MARAAWTMALRACPTSQRLPSPAGTRRAGFFVRAADGGAWDRRAAALVKGIWRPDSLGTSKQEVLLDAMQHMIDYAVSFPRRIPAGRGAALACLLKSGPP